MASPLPHPHAFITSMISQLATISSSSQESSPITLSSLNSRDHKSAKSIFTTLHFLFPHELLPALDLLDRKLVTQLVVTAPQACTCPTTKSTSSTAAKSISWEIFYVRSASASTSTSKSTSRYRRVYNQSGNHYEVNLEAWNCSCPAFAYSAFGRALDLSDEQTSGSSEDDATEAEIGDDSWGWQFGGTLTKEGSGAPICKHILAAVLGRALPDLFGNGVERKEVPAVEAAGWGGGWGD